MSNPDFNTFFDEISDEIEELLEVSLIDVSSGLSLRKKHPSTEMSDEEHNDSEALKELFRQANMISSTKTISQISFVKGERVIFVNALSDDYYLRTVCKQDNLNLGILKYLLNKADKYLKPRLKAA